MRGALAGRRKRWLSEYRGLSAWILESEKSEIGNVAYLYLYLYAGDNGYLEIDTIVMDSRNEGYLNLGKTTFIIYRSN
jgi:hypothetical protein